MRLCWQRAALAGVLDKEVYKRVNLALAAWAVASIGFSAARWQLFNKPALLCACPFYPASPACSDCSPPARSKA